MSAGNLMTKPSFELIGFLNPYSNYPAPVLPVGMRRGKLVLYEIDYGPVAKNNPQEVIILPNKLLRRFIGFNPETEELFADSKGKITSYPIDQAKEFYKRILEDPNFCSEYPEMRKMIIELVSILERRSQ